MSQPRAAIMVDIDGTVALMGKGDPVRRGPYDWDRVGEDDPNWPVINLIGHLRTAGYEVVFVSGRKERCQAETIDWLIKHHVSRIGDQLFMRADNDNRADDEVKHDIYHQHIAPVWTIAYVLDDRDQVVKMWRSLGLTVLQVAAGDF